MLVKCEPKQSSIHLFYTSNGLYCWTCVFSSNQLRQTWSTYQPMRKELDKPWISKPKYSGAPFTKLIFFTCCCRCDRAFLQNLSPHSRQSLFPSFWLFHRRNVGRIFFLLSLLVKIHLARFRALIEKHLEYDHDEVSVDGVQKYLWLWTFSYSQPNTLQF